VQEVQYDCSAGMGEIMYHSRVGAEDEDTATYQISIDRVAEKRSIYTVLLSPMSFRLVKAPRIDSGRYQYIPPMNDGGLSGGDVRTRFPLHAHATDSAGHEGVLHRLGDPFYPLPSIAIIV
jgi:hypothetical protein